MWSEVTACFASWALMDLDVGNLGTNLLGFELVGSRVTSGVIGPSLREAIHTGAWRRTWAGGGVGVEVLLGGDNLHPTATTSGWSDPYVVFYFLAWGERWFTCPLYRRWRWVPLPLDSGDCPRPGRGVGLAPLWPKPIGDQLQHFPPWSPRINIEIKTWY
jgi:hypothetical protein